MPKCPGSRRGFFHEHQKRQPTQAAPRAMMQHAAIRKQVA
jgi:hypothetical protein